MRFLLCSLLTGMAACASVDVQSSHSTSAPETSGSAALLASVASLEGSWEGQSPEGSFTVEFKPTAAGSAMVETMMPGTPNEMVNLYTVHGSGLNMTHYCAAGNQPHMRATAIQDGRMAFTSTGVSGRASDNEHYMAEMTLVMVDKDHIEQHWTSGDDEDAPPMVFQLARVR